METSFFSKLIFFSLLSCTLLIGCGKTETQKPFVNPTEFILPNNILSPTLLKILELTHVEHDGTLDSIVQETQKNWLRKPGVERWQMDKKYENLNTTLKPLFEDVGLLDEIRPTQKEYTELPENFLDKVSVHFISAPMQINPDGTTRRANTGDTIKLWLAQMDQPGPILAISNQPYVGYQHAVLKTFLPETVKFETIGNKKVIFESDVQLDNLARWLYQENAYRKQKTAQ